MTCVSGRCCWLCLAWLVLPLPVVAAPSAPLHTVAVDASAVDAAAYRALDLLGLQRKLTLRLSQAGFAVVDPARAPRIRVALRVDATAREIVIVATSAAARAERRVARAPEATANLDGLHLELIHKAVEAARAVAPPPSRPAASRPATRPAARPASRPAPASPPTPPRATPPPTARRATTELGAAGGLLLGQGGADLWVGLGARWGWSPGLGIRAAIDLTPPLDDRPAVLEWSARLGPSWRLPLWPARGLDVELAALAGVLHHAFWLDGASPTRGTRWDFVVGGEVVVGWQLGRALRLALTLGMLLADEAREHRLDGQRVWRRSALRARAGLLFIFCP